MGPRSIALLSLLIALAAAGFMAWRHRAPQVVFINSSKVIEAYAGTATARAAFKQRTDAWKANADTLADELEAAIKKYEREQGGMTEKERGLSQELLRNQREEYYRYQHNTDQRIQEEGGRMTADLVAKIDALVKEHARRKGYRVVLGANGNGTLVYADEALDITDEVIRMVNAVE